MRQIFNPSRNLNQEKSIVMKNTISIRSMFAFAGSILLIASSNSSFAGIGDPAGIVQVSVPANNTVISATPYARPIVSFGTVSSVAASSGNTTLTVSLDSGSDALPSFTNTDPNVDAWYVVEILDGPALGLILNAVGGSASTITVSGTLPGTIDIAANSKFAVRKDWTLASLFGSASATNVFGSGTTPSSGGVNAQVQIYNVSTGTLVSYYINASGGNYNWRSTGSTANRNHAPVGLGTGFSIVNRKATPFLYPLSGEYRTTRTRLLVPAGKKTLLGNPGVFDTTFTASTITGASPNRGTSTPSGSHDLYAVWNAPTRSFANYRIGGTGLTNRPAASAYSGGTRTNPVISKFTALLATPGNTNNPNVVTIAPAFTTAP